MTLCSNYTFNTIKVFHDTVNYISTLTFSGSYGEAFHDRIFDRLVDWVVISLKQKVFIICISALQSYFCHTRAQLIISDHLIIISDDKLGLQSGIIIYKIRPAGRPTDQPSAGIV